MRGRGRDESVRAGRERATQHALRCLQALGVRPSTPVCTCGRWACTGLDLVGCTEEGRDED